MVLLIDNYDSFTYNLYQLIGALEPNILVARNDELSIAQIESLAPSQIIISPGPGRPENAGICSSVVKHFAGRTPLLGVCLGHQVICQTLGATVSYAQILMHGKISELELDTNSQLFRGLPLKIQAARYHSLIVQKNSIPAEIRITASTAADEVMAVEHFELPIYGVQFHPESILTAQGSAILKNFLAISIADKNADKDDDKNQERN